MKISKKDALMWFEFFASLPYGEELTALQEEIAYATFNQIEKAVEAKRQGMKEQIKGLKALEMRTLYVGDDDKFPEGCRSCLLGSGLSAIRKTNVCNIECKFCYNFGHLEDIAPVGEGMWEIGGTKYYEQDIDLLLAIQDKPSGISYVYLEPFMEIEKYYPIIRKFKSAGIYQHMYTNGTLANETNLKALAEAGLDELRFNIGGTNCSDKVIANMGLAKKYIKHVGIETPMTPEFFQAFMAKKEAILKTGIDFINCAELHLNENNLDNYEGENLYIARQGYISPVWSREISLELMKQAGEETWPLVVHDCSNDTKFARGLNYGQKNGMAFGATNYGFEFQAMPYYAFLPILEDETFEFIEEEVLPDRYQFE